MKSKPKVVVTGGLGFIGRHLVGKLNKLNYDVLVIDNKRGISSSFFPKGVKVEGFDVCCQNTLCNFFNGREYVFHLAAQPKVLHCQKYPLTSFRANVEGTVSVLNACMMAGNVKRHIFASSSSVYGSQDLMPLSESMTPRPKSCYALQKYQSEEWCKAFYENYGVKSSIARIFNVYGPHMNDSSFGSSVVSNFLKQKREGQKLTIVGRGNQSRDFIHVSDVVNCMISMIEKDEDPVSVFNIGSGQETTVNELAALFKTDVLYIEDRDEPKRSVADISKAKSVLGWEPEISLNQGIKELN